jgi:hypothetical protein
MNVSRKIVSDICRAMWRKQCCYVSFSSGQSFLEEDKSKLASDIYLTGIDFSGTADLPIRRAKLGGPFQ